MYSPPHISDEQLAAFVSGTCTPAQANELELHIDACRECREMLSALVRGQRADGLEPTRRVPLARVGPGDVVGGKYKVERVLGSGGMGTVVSAWHQQLNQRVALKFMRPELAADPQASARFLREGRAAARLKTPHAGRVLDLDTAADGTPYLVMELLEGETLAACLAREGRLPVERALRVVRQALAALAEAHALSIVHRDFKPANLFLARGADGSELVKVLDFGLAKSVHPEIEQGLTGTTAHMLIGSPPYMAPEQVNQGPVDARTDVWAVGVVLYELLTGRLPFPGNTVHEVLAGVQRDAPRPLSALRPDAPAALGAVIDRCLSKRPDERFADAAALSKALQGIEHSAAAPRRRFALWATVAACAALAAGAAWWSSRAAQAVSPPPPPPMRAEPAAPAAPPPEREVERVEPVEAQAPVEQAATAAPSVKRPPRKRPAEEVFEERQ